MGAPVNGRNGPNDLHHGIKFQGTDGWIFVTRGKIEASKRSCSPTRCPRMLSTCTSQQPHGQLLRMRPHAQGPDLRCGNRPPLASMCHLGSISIRLGRKLQWDPEKQEFVGDEEAQRWSQDHARALVV